MYSKYIKHSWLLGLLILVNLTSCHQRIAGDIIRNKPILVSSDWLSIPLLSPVRAEWDVQIIYLDLSNKFEPSFAPMGIRLDGDSIITPEVELVSKAGQKEPFHLSGFVNANRLTFENSQIPRGSTFSELRIRSPKPLVLSRISWTSYMPGDTKTGMP